MARVLHVFFAPTPFPATFHVLLLRRPRLRIVSALNVSNWPVIPVLLGPPPPEGHCRNGNQNLAGKFKCCWPGPRDVCSPSLFFSPIPLQVVLFPTVGPSGFRARELRSGQKVRVFAHLNVKQRRGFCRARYLRAVWMCNGIPTPTTYDKWNCRRCV